MPAPPETLQPAPAAAVTTSVRHRPWKLIVAVVAVTLALAASVLVWVFFPRKGKFPLAIGKLPKELISVRADDPNAAIAGALFMRPSDVSEQARWSYFAHMFCGGRDLFHDLVFAGAPADGIAALILDKDNIRRLLSCGRAIARHVEGGEPIYTLTLDVGGSAQSLTLLKWADADLPEVPPFLKSVSNPKHLKNTRQRAAPAPRDASSWAVAKIDGEGVWIAGDIVVLEAFGEGFDPDGRNKHFEGELLASRVGAGPGRSTAAGYGHLDLDERAEPRVVEPLAVVGYVTDEEARAHAEKAMQRVTLWSQEFVNHDGFSKRHAEYTTKTARDAKELQDALESYLRAARRYEKGLSAMIDRRLPAIDRDEDEESRVWVHHSLAIENARVRGLANATVSSSGNTVALDCDDEPEPSDVAASNALADFRRGRSAHAASMIDALIAGRDTSEADEKAVWPELNELLHIPESMTLAELGDLPIPGGARCRRREGFVDCSYEKWDRKTTLAKVRALAEKAGYSWKETATEYDDIVVTAAKGPITRTFRIVGPRDHSAPTTLNVSR